jgi:hypothetical protein
MDSNVQVAQILIAFGLALALDWIPGLKTWWDKIDETRKRLYMAITLIVVLLVLSSLDCGLNGKCPTDWQAYVLGLILIYGEGVAVNQTVHGLFKPSEKTVE